MSKYLIFVNIFIQVILFDNITKSFEFIYHLLLQMNRNIRSIMSLKPLSLQLQHYLLLGLFILVLIMYYCKVRSSQKTLMVVDHISTIRMALL